MGLLLSTYTALLKY